MKQFLNTKKKIITAPALEPGTLIVAKNLESDEHFKRAVILILEHTSEFTCGVILNKKGNVKVKEAVSHLNYNDNLYYGGNESLNTLGFIHDLAHLKNSILISENIYWCGDIFELQQNLITKSSAKNNIRFFAGFMEWLTSDIEQQISEGKWIVSHKFSWEELANNEGIWQEQLIENGNLYGMVADLPDPIMS